MQERLKGCLEALYMEVRGLMMSDKQNGLMTNIPLESEDWDPFPSS
jgi:hypothetical protein